MWTKEIAKKALDGFSTVCPKGHFMENLGEVVVICSSCGNELMVQCHECKEEGEEDYEWDALYLLFALVTEENLSRKAHGMRTIQ